MKQTAHKAQLANDKAKLKSASEMSVEELVYQIESVEYDMDFTGDCDGTLYLKEDYHWKELKERIKQSLTQNSERNTLGEFKTQNRSEGELNTILDKLWEFRLDLDIDNYTYFCEEFFRLTDKLEQLLTRPKTHTKEEAIVSVGTEPPKTPSPNKLEQEQLRDEIEIMLSIELKCNVKLYKSEYDGTIAFSNAHPDTNIIGAHYVIRLTKGKFKSNVELPLELTNKILDFMRSESK